MEVEIDTHENYFKVNFLHPHGPSDYFYWLSHEDICLVPNIHIISTIKQPKLALATAATPSSSLKYVNLDSEKKYIQTCFDNFASQLFFYTFIFIK